MPKAASFDKVLEAIGTLPEDQQAELVELVGRRLAERGRRRVITDVRSARRQYGQGKTRAASVDDIMRELEA